MTIIKKEACSWPFVVRYGKQSPGSEFLQEY